MIGLAVILGFNNIRTMEPLSAIALSKDRQSILANCTEDLNGFCLPHL